MTGPRPSSSFAFRVVESIGGSLTRLLVGAALFTPGMIGYLHEMQHGYDCDESLHKGDITIFVGLMVAGALVVVPSFGKTLTNIFVTVSPYLPMIGGRREGDIPKPPVEESK
jgi:hypothetical protein